MRICPHCETPTLDKVCPYDGYQTVDASIYMEPDHDPFIGKSFQERYRIEERLAIGGMGTVYRASQIAVGRPVAIKILRREVVHDLRVVARFQQEALAVAGLHHPNTVRIFDFGQSVDGHLFLVMEFLEGLSLGDLIDAEAPLDEARVIGIGGQILDALAEAHANGIIHRDLKPDNIFVTKVGLQPDFAKILDFGIAKLDRGEARQRQITQTGIVVGSPGYMAPEQVQSLALTAQVDIYAVGAVMYEMLCGTPVFHGESAFEIAMKQVNEAPALPQVGGKEVRSRLAHCIMSFLAKEPEGRPQGATEALRRLQACIADESDPGPHIRPMRPSQSALLSGEVKAGTRHRRSTSVFFSPGTGMSTFGGHRAWLLLLGVVIAGMVGIAVTLTEGSGTKPSLADAERKRPSGPASPVPPAPPAPPVAVEVDASSGLPEAGTPVATLKEKTAPVAALPTGPTSYPDVASVPAGMDWAIIQSTQPKASIHFSFSRRDRPLLGKGRVVVAWPKGTTRPKVRLKLFRYESYTFRVPRNSVNNPKSKRITLEFDDTMGGR